MNLYTLYAFPSENHALAAHHREKGEHYGKSEGPDFALVSNSNTGWKMEYPSHLIKLDWDAKPNVEESLKSVVLSAAVGYEDADFIRFVESIRAHYQGEVVLLVRDNASASLFSTLEKHNIQVVKTEEAGGERTSPAWYRINTLRWQFYQENCIKGKHDVCMAVDFRDSLFQDDPFRGMTLPPDGGGIDSSVLHVYEHNLPMNEWHISEAKKCRGRFQVLHNTQIINAGGFIASPPALPILAKWVSVDAKRCDDQVAFNLGVHGKELKETKVISHPQGEGSINNVAWGGKFRRDSRQRFMNHNCFPAPVVHQYDLLGKD